MGGVSGAAPPSANTSAQPSPASTPPTAPPTARPPTPAQARPASPPEQANKTPDVISKVDALTDDCPTANAKVTAAHDNTSKARDAMKAAQGALAKDPSNPKLKEGADKAVEAWTKAIGVQRQADAEFSRMNAKLGACNKAGAFELPARANIPPSPGTPAAPGITLRR